MEGLRSLIVVGLIFFSIWLIYVALKIAKKATDGVGNSTYENPVNKEKSHEQHDFTKVVEELNKIQELKENGIIDEMEFTELKRKVLSKN